MLSMQRGEWVREGLGGALVLCLAASLLACGQPQEPESAQAREDASAQELDELLAGAVGVDDKADSSQGLFYRLRDGRYVFLGGPAQELIALGQAHPQTQRFTRRGATYTQSPFAYCVEQAQEQVCVSYLDRTYRADDEYGLIFGGALGRRPSVSAYKAGRMVEAMLAGGYEVQDINGADYYHGTWFGCTYTGGRTPQAFCGLYHEAHKAQQDTTRVEVSLENLPELGPDYVYEGWLIVEGAPISAGRFDKRAGFSSFTFNLLANYTDATAYVLTIEPRVQDDPAPSEVHLLAGPLEGGQAQLTMNHPAALGTDFSQSSGAFILAVPSSPGTPYSQGIWYVDPAQGASSLDLPQLPAGWTYEGWVVGEDGPVSTGRFRSLTGADSDGGGAAAGPEPTPPFPGQDFVDPAMDLLGATVVISVEPEPDNDPAPFDLKPLVGTAMDAGAGVLQPLGLNLEGQPSGLVTVTAGQRSPEADAVLVANRQGGTVTVIDAAEGVFLKNVELPGEAEPMYINHNRATGRVFVGDRAQGQVVALDDQTFDVVGTVPAGAGVFHMWANPEGERLYVNADVDKVVVVINTRTLEREGVLTLPEDLTAGSGKPHDVVVDPDGQSLYVSFVGVEGDMDAIIKLDAATGQELARVMVERDPHVSATFRGELLYAPAQEGDVVYALRRRDLSVVARVDVQGAHGAGMALDGRTFFTTNISGGGEGGLVAIDTRRGQVRHSVDTPYPVAHNVIANVDVDLVFVAHSGGASDKVSVFSYDARYGFELVSDINAGVNPFGIGLVAH